MDKKDNYLLSNHSEIAKTLFEKIIVIFGKVLAKRRAK